MPWRHMGEWRYSFTILNLSTRWRWVVSCMSLPLYPQGKWSWHSYRRLGEPQSQSGLCGEEKHLLLLPEIEPQVLGHPASSPLLYQMNYPNSQVYAQGFANLRNALLRKKDVSQNVHFWRRSPLFAKEESQHPPFAGWGSPRNMWLD
jgi:hypothetical protein